MKIVNIIGGLGNQMFQYAFALSLKEHFPNEEIRIDVTHFNCLFVNKVGAANLHNGYELDNVFAGIELKKANMSQLMKLTWFVPNYLISRIIRKIMPVRKTEFVQNPDDCFVYNSSVYDIYGSCYYEGYWQSIGYYKAMRDKLCDVFRHPLPNERNKSLINKMESSDSVGIHIRRGDYLFSDDFRGICEVDYYKSAIHMILKDDVTHVFYVFSNDREWCEEYIRPLLGCNEMIFVSDNTGRDSCWDMFLMTHCKDLIIANSSFSWWGAFLNKRKGRVIAPNKWMNRNINYDLWMPDWIRM